MTNPIRDLLHQAQLKYSKPRAAILDLLYHSKEPLTAQAIADQLNQSEGNTKYWPSTIYRTLDLLQRANLVSRLEIPGSEQGAFVLHDDEHDQHFAICLRCHKMISLHACPLHHLHHELEEAGFEMTWHRVEIYGLCQDCAQKKALSPQ